MHIPLSISPRTFDPRLPPELERNVFEIAALSRPTSIPHLMLIAWRVKDWVEPLLYRVILLDSGAVSKDMQGFPTLTPEILRRVIASRPPEFVQSVVKHLFLWAPHRNNVDTILAACVGVKTCRLCERSSTCTIERVIY
ncbi:hypothetical protein B0H13DRAFT_2662708 [Mycena leptocephala]|nr:hypothetical protein B0H13DRAFT_2662708 [Mycena leptocephala]